MSSEQGLETGIEIITGVTAMKTVARDWVYDGQSIGLVPTMGYFHEGHLSLMRASVQDAGVTAVSVYVNPTQFGPQEDLERYPRDLERDAELASREGVDVLFCPTDKEMYPHGFQTYVEVVELTQGLCGTRRPAHFRGVTTVVSKLFNIVRPDRAYFGEKDYQQLRVVERMARDLDMDVEVVPMPIAREPDGLAMSSRNAYLSARERAAALVLYRALGAAQEWVRQGERDAARLCRRVESFVGEEPLARIDYVQVVHPLTLQPLERLAGEARLLLAVFVGQTRLIDNEALAVSD